MHIDHEITLDAWRRNPLRLQALIEDLEESINEMSEDALKPRFESHEMALRRARRRRQHERRQLLLAAAYQLLENPR